MRIVMILGIILFLSLINKNVRISFFLYEIKTQFTDINNENKKC